MLSALALTTVTRGSRPQFLFTQPHHGRQGRASSLSPPTASLISWIPALQGEQAGTSPYLWDEREGNMAELTWRAEQPSSLPQQVLEGHLPRRLTLRRYRCLSWPAYILPSLALPPPSLIHAASPQTRSPWSLFSTPTQLSIGFAPPQGRQYSLTDNGGEQDWYCRPYHAVRKAAMHR